MAYYLCLFHDRQKKTEKASFGRIVIFKYFHRMGHFFKNSLLVLIVLVVLGQNRAMGQTIDSLSLLRDIKTLASAEFAGRKPGTPEHQKSVDLILDRFQKLGLSAYNNSFIADFPVNDSIAGKNLI